MQYSVNSIENLFNTIIPHFLQYPLLLTKKKFDFELFNLVVEIIHKNKDITFEDLEYIVRLKAGG